MGNGSNGEVLSPWEITTKFIDLWDANKFAYVVFTILLVLIIHKIATRTIRGKKYSWKEFLFYLISIVGWSFIMYMIMWDMMKIEASASIALLGISCVLSIVGYIAFFKILKDSEKKEWASRIISGIILAVVVFGVFIFMGSGKLALGLAGLMGSLLGFLLSLAGYNFINMVNGDSTPSTEIEDDEDSPWEPPRP